MRPNPEPNDLRAVKASKYPIADPHTRGVDTKLRVNLLEVQTSMIRIRTEKPVRTPRLHLDAVGEFRVTFAETA